MGNYLAGDVLRHTAAVSLVLLLIIITGRFVKYLAEAASGELAAEVLLPIMFYRLPGFIELLLPLALFIGILMAYGRLYVESEMVILSACGVGPLRLAGWTLLPALLVAVVVAGLALEVTPRGVERSEALLSDPEAVQGLQLLAAGRFQSSSDGSSVTYAGAIDAEEGTLQEVFAYRRDPRSPTGASVLRAQTGRIVRDPNGLRYLELEQGHRSSGQAGRLDYQLVAFDRYGERLPDAPALAAAQPVDARTTQALWSSSTAEDRAALHWRISLFAMVPIVALLAMALSKTNHRRGRYMSLAPGLLLHLAYLFLLATTRSRVAEEGAPIWNFWLLHGVFLAVALSLLFGPQLLRRLRN